MYPSIKYTVHADIKSDQSIWQSAVFMDTIICDEVNMYHEHICRYNVICRFDIE